MLKLLLIALWALYFFSPFDLIPDAIPGIGRLDDLLLLVGLYLWSRHLGKNSNPGGRGAGGWRPGRQNSGHGPGYRPGYGPGHGQAGRQNAGSGQGARRDPGTGSSSGQAYGSSGYSGAAGGSSSGDSGYGTGNAGGSNRQGSDGRGASAGRSEKRDPYEILDIQRGVTLDEVKHAYRDKAGKYHPDKVSHLGEEFQLLAKEKFQDIQWAYETILKERGER